MSTPKAATWYLLSVGVAGVARDQGVPQWARVAANLVAGPRVPGLAWVSLSMRVYRGLVRAYRVLTFSVASHNGPSGQLPPNWLDSVSILKSK